MSYKDSMNRFREQNGFYTLEELDKIICKDNLMYDVTSTLISRNLIIGSNNIFYPNITIESDCESTIEIGDNNIFLNGTHLEAKNRGKIIIGNYNFFSNGGVTIKSNMENSNIIFRNNGRFDGRINVFGQCQFGNGTQILGTINVYNCTLEDGGAHSNPDVEKRAGLIKGIGNAKNLCVKQGMVINGFGEFQQCNMESQINYHTK